jgi:hypothetical protein
MKLGKIGYCFAIQDIFSADWVEMESGATEDGKPLRRFYTWVGSDLRLILGETEYFSVSFNTGKLSGPMRMYDIMLERRERDGYSGVRMCRDFDADGKRTFSQGDLKAVFLNACHKNRTNKKGGAI